jgi:hypothetical protein
MAGEVDGRETVDRHETADAVKRFYLELRGMLRRVHLRQRPRLFHGESIIRVAVRVDAHPAPALVARHGSQAVVPPALLLLDAKVCWAFCICSLGLKLEQGQGQWAGAAVVGAAGAGTSLSSDE